VDKGNTVIVIEHNLDVIKSADHLIDMGPEGGSGGGLVIAEGTPEQVAAMPESYTGQFLEPILEGRAAVTGRRRLRAVNGSSGGAGTRAAKAAKAPAAAKTSAVKTTSAVTTSAAAKARRKAARLV